MSKFRTLAAATLIACVHTAGWSATFYSGSNNNTLVKFDTDTGIGTVIGPMGFGGIFAGAFSPTGTFYTVTDTYGGTIEAPSSLATVNLATGQATPIASLPRNDIDMLQFSSSGTLYASQGSALYTVNIGTGALTRIGAFGGFGDMMDLAVDSQGRMFGVADPADGVSPSRFYSIDTSNGAATFLFQTSEPCIMGLAFDSADNLFGTRFCGTQSSPFYKIDLAAKSVSVVGLSGIPNPHGGDIFRAPEPGTLALLGLGLAGLAATRRRKQ